MPVFRVPKDPPQELLWFKEILDELDYTTGSFDGFVMDDNDYFTWFS